jgi:hypothetical protein
MRRVSIRTLTLLLVLLLAVVSHQYLAMARPCTAVIWLAGNYSTVELD